MDQLGQVFNRIDVVVWGRADQAHTGHRITQEADVVADLAAGQLATLTRLGTLGHLDLNLISRRQVFGRHAKPARGHLFNLAAQRVTSLECVVGHDDFVTQDLGDLGAIGNWNAFELVAVTRRVFTAFAGVALATDAVHGNGQGAVGLGADGTQGHRARGETLDDFCCGLDFIDGYGFARIKFELEQAAQGHVAA